MNRHHVLDAYGCHLHVATDRRGWATLRRRLPGLVDGPAPESAGWTRFATWQPKSGITVPVVVVYINAAQHTEPVDLIDTAAHEAAHVVSALMEHIGHSISGVDEPSAYLTGWVTAWLWEAAA